jgi:hypothetical protein
LKNNIIYIIFFICGITFAQNSVEVAIDTTNIRIGEQILYQISVDKTHPSTKSILSEAKRLSDKVLFPKLVLDSLNRVEVVEELKVDTTKTKFVKKYILTSFDSGQYIIPRQQVLINSRIYLTDSLLINVATVKVDTTKQNLFPIKSIKNQPVIFDDYKNYFWLGLALLALILGLIWYYFIRKKKEEQAIEDRVPPYELAMQRLGELDGKQLWQNDKVKLYYIELTDIIRTYIERELNIPALESTTDELMETIRDFNKIKTLDLPKETVKNLQKLLQEADLVKFAKHKPMSNEIEYHRVDTENIINELKPKPREEDEVVE